MGYVETLEKMARKDPRSSNGIGGMATGGGDGRKEASGNGDEG